ncbi:MAG TPA: DUF167 domain-containing protein [Candidatus Nanoarchaeia archaeon]|nr:DUF167 domain-containing protein [Candidatus Nanoarchaeia archaeon]
MKIEVKVKTNKRESKIVSHEGNVFYVELNAKAKENEANIELIKLLSKHFKKPVLFVSGLKSKKKILEILDRC